MSISNITPGLAAYQKLAGLEPNPTANASQSNTSTSGIEQTLDSSKITVRNQQQASMVAHLFGDPSKTLENSNKMAYQAAIAKLQEILSPNEPFGENAITQENLDKNGIEYWSPENTANRIVAGASAYLEAFKNQHPELEGEALMEKFNEVVGGGLQKGFDEAKGILGDLKVFEDQVAENFNSTTSLVDKGMENFRREYLGLPPLPEPEQADKAEEDLV